MIYQLTFKTLKSSSFAHSSNNSSPLTNIISFILRDTDNCIASNVRMDFLLPYFMISSFAPLKISEFIGFIRNLNLQSF